MWDLTSLELVLITVVLLLGVYAIDLRIELGQLRRTYMSLQDTRYKELQDRDN